MVFASVASDGRKMPLIVYEKAERLTGVRHIHYLKDVNTWILSEYPKERDGGTQSSSIMTSCLGLSRTKLLLCLGNVM